MNRKLTLDEREALKLSHRKERNGKVRDRIKAVLAYDEGYSYAEIAHILLLDDETIRRHIDDYFAKNKLAPENGGSQSYLSQAETDELIAHLQEVTYLYVKDICSYVKRMFGKTYSISGMTKWLHANQFSYKKPHAVPAKANKDAQAAFVSYYEKLKEAAKKEPIYFVDSAHPQHQTKLAYGWIFKGVRKAIATTGRQYRVNIIGGINLTGHKLHFEMVDKVEADTIALFLTQLRKKHPDKTIIHIIWDNAGYHRDIRIQEFSEALGIKLHYLPVYSPNLNPIERLWKVMHECVTYNQYYETFQDFKCSVIHFFKTISRKKKLLRSRITDNFNLIQSPILAS